MLKLMYASQTAFQMSVCHIYGCGIFFDQQQ